LFGELSAEWRRRSWPGICPRFFSGGAPVEIGLVQSLAHPGGSITGIAFEAATETYGKRLQILKEILPGLKRVAVLRAVGDPNVGFAMKSLDAAAPELGVTLVPIDIKSTSDLEAAFTKIRNSEVEGLLDIAGALTRTVGTEIADRALTAHLPLCSAFRETVVAGGLARISQRGGCIGTVDLRKSSWQNGLPQDPGNPDANRV
jgi:putative tryptophan/tyrosine transport system substrate-binding protein